MAISVMLIECPWNQNVEHIMKQQNWCLALLENNFLLCKNHIIQTAEEGRFEKVSEIVFLLLPIKFLNSEAVSFQNWQCHTLILFIIFLSSQYLFLGLRASITKKYFVLFTPDSMGCVCVCVCVCGRWALVSLWSMSEDALASLSVMNGRQWTGY